MEDNLSKVSHSRTEPETILLVSKLFNYTATPTATSPWSHHVLPVTQTYKSFLKYSVLQIRQRLTNLSFQIDIIKFHSRAVEGQHCHSNNQTVSIQMQYQAMNRGQTVPLVYKTFFCQ